MAAALLVAARPELTDLDHQIGDDDHGARVTRGFTAAAAKIAEPDGQKLVMDDDIAGVLRLAATTLISTVGGASGPLYGTALLRAATVVKGIDLGPQEVARLLQAAVTGIEERGQVQPGAKTMVDAWAPAAQAAERAAAAGDDVIAVLAAASSAAEQGAQATVTMVASKGRAALLGPRAVGHMDPGARSSSIVLRAALTAAKG